MKTRIADGVEVVTVGPHRWRVIVDDFQAGVVWKIESERFTGLVYRANEATIRTARPVKGHRATMEEAATHVATIWRLEEQEAAETARDEAEARRIHAEGEADGG